MGGNRPGPAPLVRKFHLLMNDRHRSVVDEVDQRVTQHFHSALAARHQRGPLPVRRADRQGAEAARHSRSVLAKAMRHFEILYGRRPNTREIDHLKTLPGLTADQETGQFRSIIASFDRQSLNTPFLIRFSQSDVVYGSVEGAELALDRADVSVSLPIHHGGQWEPHLTGFYQGHLKPGMTFIDVGANIGFFTVLASRLVGPEGRVIAFEPNSENCRLILLSLNSNGINNVKLYPLGLSDDEVSPTSPPTWAPTADLSRRQRDTVERGCPHSDHRLEICWPIRPVNFLKIDTEGAEGLIVAGARKFHRTSSSDRDV